MLESRSIYVSGGAPLLDDGDFHRGIGFEHDDHASTSNHFLIRNDIKCLLLILEKQELILTE